MPSKPFGGFRDSKHNFSPPLHSGIAILPRQPLSTVAYEIEGFGRNGKGTDRMGTVYIMGWSSGSIRKAVG